MQIILLLCRVLLAGVFSVAAVTKITGTERFSKTVREFGVPSFLARPLSLLVPLAELAVAVLLLVTSAGRWGGFGALVLLLIFSLAIVGNLVKGRKPECRCFGQINSRPVGWPTLLRNGVFVAGSLLVIWQGKEKPGTTIVALLSNLSGVQLFVGAIGVLFIVSLLVEGWLFLHILRQHGRLLLRLDNLDLRLVRAGLPPEEDSSQSVAGLMIGSPAPAIELPLLSGGSLTLVTLLQRGKPVLLVFSDPDCGPCNALLPAIANWEREHANALTIAVVSRGTAAANRAKAGAYDLAFVALQQDRETAETFKAPATPSALVISANGTIGSQVAMGAQAISELVARLAGAAANGSLVLHQGSAHQHAILGPAKKSRIGEPAPSFRLADLDGRPVELSDFRGRDTLVLFWNPSCGFCNSMLPELKAWESVRPEKAPELLMISTGTVEANRQMNLQSSVVLDDGFSVGRSFGVGGTPAAVLIDGAGRIASAEVIGAPAVLALAQGV
jgi:thiol-disulfide isomerase/thioredoxin/uncharacterized membrane protein YphA (DoxX/SURF4 family)